MVSQRFSLKTLLKAKKKLINTQGTGNFIVTLFKILVFEKILRHFQYSQILSVLIESADFYLRFK
jgi:hypothetical protein